MNHGRPHSQCPFCHKTGTSKKDGHYFRADDSRHIQRYKCRSCGKKYSAATFSLAYGQKKRRVNHKVWQMLASSMSMRRVASLLNIHPSTVKRKLIYLAERGRLAQENMLAQIPEHSLTRLQFDDLITSEHTKLKPLSITIAISVNPKIILSAQVSTIAAFGHLAEISRKKYGKRKSTHWETMLDLFHKIYRLVAPGAIIESDEHKLYPKVIAHYLPDSQHIQYKGGRGCVAGQGELKKLGFDPLFAINHTCAMFRANINRLVRRTWCTTKDPQMLQNHLDLFVHYFNSQILKAV